MNRFLTMTLGGICLAGGLSAQDLPSGDAARGETLMGQCRTCHGADGIARLVSAPHIAGDPETYLAAQLIAYREGVRQNEMMSLVVKALSDQDVADLAAWYASQPFTVTSADFSNAPEACVACHGVDGMAAQDGVPHIAGDSAEYVAAQLRAYRDGTRENDTMGAVALDLSDAEIDELADWFSSIEVAAE